MAYYDYTDSRAPTPKPSPVVPGPGPDPAPAPTPVAPRARWRPTRDQILLALLACAVLLLGGIVAWDHLPRFPHPGPVPGPVVPEPLRVLFVYESSDPLSREQNNILSSPAVRSYLTGHCLKDGDLPAWRFWDKDVDASRETATWQAAWQAAKGEPTPLPKIIIFTKATMVGVPLPADEQATLALLKKYGGP